MANQILFGGFQRLRNFPLDPSGIFKYLDNPEKPSESLKYYIANNPIAYEGQLAVVIKDPDEKNNGFYLITGTGASASYLEFPDIKITNEISNNLGLLKQDFEELEETSNAAVALVGQLSARVDEFDSELDSVKEKVSVDIEASLKEYIDTTDNLLKKADEDLSKKIDDADNLIYSKIAEADGLIYGKIEEYKKALQDQIDIITNADLESLDDRIEQLEDLSRRINKLLGEEAIQNDLITLSNIIASTQAYKSLEAISTENKSNILINTANIGNILSRLEIIEREYVLISTFEEKITEITVSISNLETSIKGLINETSSKIYEKITEVITAHNEDIKAVNDKLSNIQNVEYTEVFNIGESKVFTNAIEIREIRIHVQNPSIENGNTKDIIAVLIADDKNIKHQLVKSDELILTERDSIFEYNIIKKFDVSEVSIYLETENMNFYNASGKIYIKYVNIN